MIYNSQSRRYFLQGLGKSLLALPILPSLIPKASAQTVSDQQKFFIMVTSGHGGKGHSTDWYPAPFINNFEGNWFTKRQLFAANAENDFPHIMRHALLRNILSADPSHPNGNVDNNNQRLSHILGSFLNPYLDKMNLLVGIDGAMSYYGHSRGVYAGNSWFNEKTSSGDPNPQLTWETLDQFLGRSPKFYQDRDAISTPVVNLTRWNSYYEGGYGASRQDGLNIERLYGNLFEKYQETSDPQVIAARQQRQYLLDKVYEDYKRITDGAYGLARKISSEDRSRLKDHADFLQDTQKKFKSIINSCSEVSQPNGDIRIKRSPEAERYWNLATDLMVAAIQCGSSRIGIMTGNSHFRYKGDYHQEVAHAANNEPDKQLLHNKDFRWQAENLVHNLVSKLDAIGAGNGQKLLDKGMVAWVHEAGDVTHSHHNIGVATFGSVDGFFKTGNLVDYRNLENLGLLKNHQAGHRSRPGIPLSRLLANIAQAYGHVPGDYRRFNRPGYGDSSKFVEGGKSHRANPNGHVPYPKELRDSLDDKLPIIT